MNKAYKIKLYPNQKQQIQIDKTIGCCRFIYNQMLSERKSVYELLKDDKEKLYSYKYKTEKEYKQEFDFLSESSSRALQQSRVDLETAYKNFYSRVKKKAKKLGFPKFKSKKLCKLSYREPQVGKSIEIKDNRIKLLKVGYVKFKGLSNNFQGVIKSVTITKRKDEQYVASILVEQDQVKKKRVSNNKIGIDLGLKEFIVCSDGESINGIKLKLYEIEKEIKKIQKQFSRKINGSKRKEKCRLKLNKIYQYKTDFLNHFQWHLVNKLCSENQTICLEDLNVAGMKQNRKLAHAIHYINFGSFIIKLKQKALEYETDIITIGRFFPSSKICSSCGQIKQDLQLSDRQYICDCGLEIDRDLNASINILREGLNSLSLEYNDYKHGENVRLKKVIYNFNGQFSEKCLLNLV
jgi:putative transposase